MSACAETAEASDWATFAGTLSVSACAGAATIGLAFRVVRANAGLASDSALKGVWRRAFERAARIKPTPMSRSAARMSSGSQLRASVAPSVEVDQLEDVLVVPLCVEVFGVWVCA